MTHPSPVVCPHLGLAGDPTLSRTWPDHAHRCYAQTPAGAPDEAHQAAFCLTASHADCPFYRPPAPVPADLPRERPRTRPAAWWRILPWAGLVVLVVVVAYVYFNDLRTPPLPAPAVALTVPPATAPITPTSPAPTPTPEPLLVSVATPTFTPEPGGRILALSPKAGDAGWFASGEARGNRLGDSFLYAGYYNGQAFISAIRFDLSSVPRGAPIRAATLQLMGLKGDRFNPAAGGTWSVQLLPAAALPDFTRAGFQAVFNASAAVTLLPTLYPADLMVGRPNTWALDPGGRDWLAGQLLDGATAVIARITGPAGGDDTLFAWDSGAGPATAGTGPQLVLHLGPPPATPPPLPTEAVIVATLTPTPANILTVAAEAWTATAVALTTGTYTPLPYRPVTPTPTPANLATVQALALLRGLPPVVPHTPTPANEATAEMLALYATAQAFLTGTPTPPPADAVTPVIITPTPLPANVFTAAARFLQATADAATTGTPTPWPYNAVIATATPPWIVITNTPAPANAATATAVSAYATAVSLVIGTFTPLPPNAATPTPPGYVPPTPVATPVSLCPDPRARIVAPAAGARVSGSLELRGSATHEAFGYYTLAVAPGSPAAGQYFEFGRITSPVVDGGLGRFDTTSVRNGVYTLRLVVVDAAGNVLPACEVAVQVEN